MAPGLVTTTPGAPSSGSAQDTLRLICAPSRKFIDSAPTRCTIHPPPHPAALRDPFGFPKAMLNRHLQERGGIFPGRITPRGSQSVRGEMESLMTKSVCLKIACPGAVVAAVLISASAFNSTHVKAQSSGDSRIQIGMAAAPVPLNMKGKNPALVGLGSYFVNVVGDCNGCHSAGPATEFTPTGSPHFNEKKMVNTTTSLAGAGDFGYSGQPP